MTQYETAKQMAGPGATPEEIADEYLSLTRIRAKKGARFDFNTVAEDHFIIAGPSFPDSSGPRGGRPKNAAKRELVCCLKQDFPELGTSELARLADIEESQASKFLKER